MTDAIAVGEKRQIYKPSTNELFCIDITAENIDSIQRYDKQNKTPADWRFGDPCPGDNSVPTATISFTEEGNGLLKIDVVPFDEEVLAWHRQTNVGGRRSRKVKKSKTSQKRPTARRRRSSKARKARKARATRRR